MTTSVDLWTAPGLSRSKAVRHGFSGRRGGVSGPPFDSLNLSDTVGDDPGRVRENRRRVVRALGLEGRVRVLAGAVHGRQVAVVSRAPPGEEACLAGVDALLTARRDVTLMVLGADCPLVFLYDPAAGPRERGAIGIVHAGWRGITVGVLEAALATSVDTLGFDPRRTFAAITPCIGPCCFEVGEDVAALLEAQASGARAARPAREAAAAGSRPRVDLARILRAKLQAGGIDAERIEEPGECTRCHAARFFSHRASGGRTGRGGALAALTAGPGAG